MTFSIVARCTQTDMFGVSVCSSSPAVAARCAFARAGIGAVASQNVTDPSLGGRTLDLMALGASASDAIAVLQSSTHFMEFRQVLAVDRHGNSAIHSGANALGIFAQANADNVACGGNLLANEHVPSVMVDAFVHSSEPLAERLLTAMQAGLDAGGEAGPVHSAGLLLVRDQTWPVANLRIDWTGHCPISELQKLWQRYKPQLEDYVTRAQDPSAAPSYGVPGDR